MSDSQPEKELNMFNDRDTALDLACSLLQLIQLLAERHNFPFLAVVQPNADWMRPYHYFPEDITGSELKAAWYELSG